MDLLGQCPEKKNVSNRGAAGEGKHDPKSRRRENDTKTEITKIRLKRRLQCYNLQTTNVGRQQYKSLIKRHKTL